MMTYGSEACYLDDEVRRKINGANSRMVSVIIDNTQKQEVVEETCTFNLVWIIRVR